MSVKYTGIDPVDKLYGVNITGNLVPLAWCHKIVGKNGKANSNAIIILSELLYWYRPKTVQDDEDPGSMKLQKKFKADLLQLSYEQLEQRVNLSRDQCKRALKQLERMGLIKRHYRTIPLQYGRRLNNVMYIELFTDRLLELTNEDAGDPRWIKPHRVCDKTDEPYVNNCTAGQIKPMTNTENTTEITNKDYNSIYQEEVERVRDQVDYEILTKDMKADRGMIDEMIGIIADMNLYATGPQSINGERIPAQIVRDRLRKVNSYVMKKVLDSMRAAPGEVGNARGYILTSLFNAASTYDIGLDMEVNRDMFRKEACAWEA